MPLIAIVTFVTAILTLLTGFGLGTVLTPVFTIFYDVKLAVLMVAIVHLLNNLFKLYLFRAHVDLGIVRRFGVLSIVEAFVGAMLQASVSSGPLKAFLGLAFLLLGAVEFLPSGKRPTLPKKVDVIGGFASGLLGGLIGNQGAIRSAYLLNYQITKEQFIATATVIASVIDLTRIPLYLVSYHEQLLTRWTDIVPVLAVAYCGTLVGTQLLKFVDLGTFKKGVAACVVLLGVGLVLGLI
ncbi:MAG: sulfite exporter TauE/SafE family protein [Candidatus Abyssubacteria bacterium]